MRLGRKAADAYCFRRMDIENTLTHTHTQRHAIDQTRSQYKLHHRTRCGGALTRGMPGPASAAGASGHWGIEDGGHWRHHRDLRRRRGRRRCERLRRQRCRCRRHRREGHQCSHGHRCRQGQGGLHHLRVDDLRLPDEWVEGGCQMSRQEWVGSRAQRRSGWVHSDTRRWGGLIPGGRGGWRVGGGWVSLVLGWISVGSRRK